ncbi:MAG TPA: hypothetical protein VJV23_14600, partial [Candidatus Polarisedimenticolia bacterium]|nr:hypothetical protein [Candidatus Polarisedimenticolia bacterium]
MIAHRFSLHGLPVVLETADPSLASFVQAHFEAEEGADPDAAIRVDLSWRWGPAGGLESLARGPAGQPAERAGRGLFLWREPGGGAARARWTRVPGFPELTMSFELSGHLPPRLRVGAACAYEPRGLGRRLEYLRPGRADRKRNRLFFKLMYHAVYYPIAWYLRRTRGWGWLHASAVTLPGGAAVLLAGMGGVGKSTLGLTLLSRPGARLLSDNLLFHDEQRIYACPEPVRLDASALAGVAASGVEPERTSLPLAAHPKPTYAVPRGSRAAAAAPGAVFFLRVAPDPGMEDLPAAEAARLMAAGNDLAREIEDFRPCAALLEILSARRGGPEPAPPASLERLLGQARCVLFRIGADESVPATAARL